VFESHRDRQEVSLDSPRISHAVHGTRCRRSDQTALLGTIKEAVDAVASRSPNDVQTCRSGFIEKIPHLTKLGINAVELLPVHEYYVDDFLTQKGLTS
jgi:hypothetical protein